MRLLETWDVDPHHRVLLVGPYASTQASPPPVPAEETGSSNQSGAR